MPAPLVAVAGGILLVALTGVVDKARGSVWFAEQEQAGLVQPTVEAAIAQALSDQPA